jgi:hypothetical protein
MRSASSGFDRAELRTEDDVEIPRWGYLSPESMSISGGGLI